MCAHDWDSLSQVLSDSVPLSLPSLRRVAGLLKWQLRVPKNMKAEVTRPRTGRVTSILSHRQRSPRPFQIQKKGNGSRSSTGGGSNQSPLSLPLPQGGLGTRGQRAYRLTSIVYELTQEALTEAPAWRQAHVRSWN